MSSQRVIMGAFRTVGHAQQAIYELEHAGVDPQTISAVVPEHSRDEFARVEKHTKAPEGAAIGGASGVALGALAAGLTAVAGIAIPGLGLFAAGPLVAALAGAGAGGAAGGAIGGLIGLGIPEHEAKFHTSVLKEGGVVVVVTTEDTKQRKTAEEVLGKLSVKSDSAKGTTAHV